MNTSPSGITRDLLLHFRLRNLERFKAAAQEEAKAVGVLFLQDPQREAHWGISSSHRLSVVVEKDYPFIVRDWHSGNVFAGRKALISFKAFRIPGFFYYPFNTRSGWLRKKLQLLVGSTSSDFERVAFVLQGNLYMGGLEDVEQPPTELMLGMSTEPIRE